MAGKSSFTSRELLIRIDERQKVICREIKEIKEVLTHKVDNDEDFQQLVNDVRINRAWRIYVSGAFGVITAVLALASKRLLFFLFGGGGE